MHAGMTDFGCAIMLSTELRGIDPHDCIDRGFRHGVNWPRADFYPRDSLPRKNQGSVFPEYFHVLFVDLVVARHHLGIDQMKAIAGGLFS